MDGDNSNSGGDRAVPPTPARPGRTPIVVLVGAFAMLAFALALPGDGSPGVLSPIPAPLSMESESGRLFRRGPVQLAASSRIIVRDASLRPVTQGLEEMLWTLADLDLRVVRTTTRMKADEGDVVLAVDPSLPEEGYILSTRKQITVTGGTPTGVAWGLASLIQIGTFRARGASFPRVRIVDQPAFPYRGVMVDVARKPYSLDELKDVVGLAQFYKVRFLHLHLTDDQAFTFPATTVDQVRPWRTFELSELEELQEFATNRGVTVLPEIDLPGHSQALIDSDPARFALNDRSANPRTIHIGRESVYEAIDTIIGEVAQVFEDSPYIHIGGDEASLAGFASDAETTDFLEAKGLESVEDLQRYFIARAAEMVRRRGKRPVVWEGFGRGSVEIPRDVLVMAWETAYRRPDSLVADGYEIVNVSWKPLYVAWGRRWGLDDLLRWSPYRWENWYPPTPSYRPIEIQETEAVLGGQMAVWEQDGFLALPALRSRLPVVAGTLWQGEGASPALADRLKRADGLLGLLLHPALVLTEGGFSPGYDGPDVNRRDWFTDALIVRADPVIPGDRVLATFDRSAPDEIEDRFEGPRRLTASGPVRFQVVDQTGRPRGSSWTRYFERRPIRARLEGGLASQDGDPSWNPHQFTAEATVVLEQLGRVGRLHVTTDGKDPNRESPLYDGPISIDRTTRVRAQVVSESGAPLGEALNEMYTLIPTVDHRAVDRPVATYPGDPARAAAPFALDGLIDRARLWSTTPGQGEARLDVDLEALVDLGEVRVYTYWDGAVSYRYRVTGSRDGKSWVLLADASENSDPATAEGYVHKIEAHSARWIRIEFLPSEPQRRGHLVELAVFAAQGS